MSNILENKTVTCSCHCGDVKFQCELTNQLGEILTSKCNCTFCIKTRGWEIKVLFKDFKLLQGEESIGLYQFGHKINEFSFCKKCGIQLFGLIKFEGIPDSPYYCVSVPTIEGLNEEDLEKLESKVYYMDGKNDAWENQPKCIKYL